MLASTLTSLFPIVSFFLGASHKQTTHTLFQMVILVSLLQILLPAHLKCRSWALYDACVLKDMMVTELDMVPSLVELTDLALDLIRTAGVQGYSRGLWFGITHCQ